MDLVILAGGKGSRIKHLNRHNPKPMVRIDNKIFLQLLINHYAKFNFKNIFILAGYKGKLIKKKFHGKIQNFTKIHCIIEKKPLDTGGALFSLKKKIDKDFILINGDTFFDLKSPLNLTNNFNKKKIGSLTLVKNVNSKSIKFNNLKLDRYKNLIKVKNSNYINAGIYYFTKKIFKYIKNKKISLEKEILPKLLKLKKLQGKYINNFFLDIGSQKSLLFAKNNLSKILNKPAIFFDQDVVIYKEKRNKNNFKSFKLKKNVIKTFIYILNKNYYLFILTNQINVKKNKYSIENFFNLHFKMKQKLEKKKIYIHDIGYLPEYNSGLIKNFEISRKHNKNSHFLIKQIQKKWFINMKKSYFVSEKKTDMKDAKKLNLKFKFLESDIFMQIKKYI